jgi:hypothetical protein
VREPAIAVRSARQTALGVRIAPTLPHSPPVTQWLRPEHRLEVVRRVKDVEDRTADAEDRVDLQLVVADVAQDLDSEVELRHHVLKDDGALCAEDVERLFLL